MGLKVRICATPASPCSGLSVIYRGDPANAVFLFRRPISEVARRVP